MKQIKTKEYEFGIELEYLRWIRNRKKTVDQYVFHWNVKAQTLNYEHLFFIAFCFLQNLEHLTAIRGIEFIKKTIQKKCFEINYKCYEINVEIQEWGVMVKKWWNKKHILNGKRLVKLIPSGRYIIISPSFSSRLPTTAPMLPFLLVHFITNRCRVGAECTESVLQTV